MAEPNRTTTESGLVIYDEFADTNGRKVRVQESSIATESRCWIFIGGEGDEGAAHLNVEQAKRLRGALDAFIGERTDALDSG